MTQLWGIGGWATSGKDAVADILERDLGWSRTYMSSTLERALIALNPIVVVTAEEVRALFAPTEELVVAQFVPYATLHKILGYERSKQIADVRRLLQRLGTEVGRNILGYDVWVNAAFRTVDEWRDLNRQDVAITGIRFFNEHQAIRDRRGVLVWVDRPGVEPVNVHSSDNTLNREHFDVIIENDGSLEDLADKVKTVVKGTGGQ